jgi:hypothetical protein
MAVKGPNGRDPLLDVYDVPPSVEKGLLSSSHHSVRITDAEGKAERVHGAWAAVCRPWLCPYLL